MVGLNDANDGVPALPAPRSACRKDTRVANTSSFTLLEVRARARFPARCCECGLATSRCETLRLTAGLFMLPMPKLLLKHKGAALRCVRQKWALAAQLREPETGDHHPEGDASVR